MSLLLPATIVNKFLSKERTCHWLAQAINDAAQTYDYALWGYVFMPEHIHLLVYPRKKYTTSVTFLLPLKNLLVEKQLNILKNMTQNGCNGQPGNAGSARKDFSGNPAVVMIAIYTRRNEFKIL